MVRYSIPENFQGISRVGYFVGDIMIRGTTPTLKLKLNGIETSRLASVYVTIKQGEKEVTKTNDDGITAESKSVLSAPLTQEDTLTFDQGYVYIQLRAMTTDDLSIASKTRLVLMDDILKEGVIT